MTDKLIGLLIGFPIGVAVTITFYELSGLWPRWVMRVDADEYTEGRTTKVHCKRCGNSVSFSTSTLGGALSHRMEFVAHHAFCARSDDDEGQEYGEPDNHEA